MRPLRVETVRCCICREDEADVVAEGLDFEYATSPDTFTAVRCRTCHLIYLNPRPCLEELERIYPANYHAFQFTAAEFGFVYRVRERLEARRVLRWCRGLPKDARILDIGCGDGFHISLLQRYGAPSWRVEGIDSDRRAIDAAQRRGLTVRHGFVESLDESQTTYDLILLIMTIEHVAEPVSLVSTARQLLRPGGRLVIVTDNTDSLDFQFARGRYWGGYHFPRHWSLFCPATVHRLAQATRLDVERLTSMMSPVNWVYTVRNWLTGHGAPSLLVERFSLRSPLSLAVFTVIDRLAALAGRGAILQVELRRPSETVTVGA